MYCYVSSGRCRVRSQRWAPYHDTESGQNMDIDRTQVLHFFGCQFSWNLVVGLATCTWPGGAYQRSSAHCRRSPTGHIIIADLQPVITNTIQSRISPTVGNLHKGSIHPIDYRRDGYGVLWEGGWIPPMCLCSQTVPTELRRLGPGPKPYSD